LRETQQKQCTKQKNAGASYAHTLAFASFWTPGKPNSFVIDLAASHHMIQNKSLFTNFKTTNVPIKTGGSLDNIWARGTGSVLVILDGKVLNLVDCLWVPNISQQIILLV
jgi:hypothetical protein